MEQYLPVALQWALGAASIAIVVIAAVVVHAWFRISKQLDRVVTSVERVEAELVPLAREARVLVERLRTISEHTAGAASDLLLPFRAFNRTVGLLQTGVATFLQAMWQGRPRTQPRTSASSTPHNGDQTE